MLMPTRDRTELGELVGKPGETLTETLRRTLLEMIIFGYFEPGVRLYPERIAERFNVSLTPVREALMRLAAEGFIVGVQRRGFHVRNPDANQVMDLWQVRLALELMAGEILIDRIERGELTPAVVEELEDIQKKLDSDPETVSHRQKHELNGRFHHWIVELSGNDLLISTYRGIQMQVLNAWVQRGLDSWRARHASETEEHRRIIRGLRTRDKEAFAKAMRVHLARSLKDAIADLAAKSGSLARDDETRTFRQ
jgi:DNA-binding GntR family transcriptional regulator